MDKQTGPKGFLVVLPSEIIEIPQDSDKSWLTLFYSLPRIACIGTTSTNGKSQRTKMIYGMPHT